jgi:NAD(P)-dependent dehydrogenase (short-subunit alcohol dehydrogenase family)
MSGQVALVTGGSRGIGRGIAERFLAEGLSVVIADSDAKAGRATEAKLKALGDCWFVRTDVSQGSQVSRCVRETVRRFGRLDVLVNNAGIADPVSNLDVKRWHQIIAVNLTGAFLCAKAAVPHLRKIRGRIVNIASTRAMMSEPDTEAYAASKGASWRSPIRWRSAWGRTSASTASAPAGSIPDMLPSVPKTTVSIPLAALGGRRMSPRWLFFLISPDSEFITGQNYVIDGGMTKKMIYED